jgi:hypothetical protein
MKNCETYICGTNKNRRKEENNIYMIFSTLLLFEMGWYNGLYDQFKRTCLLQLTILIGACFAAEEHPRAPAAGKAPSYP